MREKDAPLGKYLSRSYWLITGRMNEKLRHHGLRIAQYSILMYLYHHPGVSQEEIVSSLKFDKALCSREVKKLEQSGLVQRRRKEEDLRSYALRVTPAGEAIREDLERIGDDLNREILRGFTPDEEEAVYSLITRLLSNLEAKENDIAERCC